MSHQTKRMRQDAARLRESDRAARSSQRQIAELQQRPGQCSREIGRLDQRDEELIATLIESQGRP
jgi:seryl-tRNA synthetase